jgi:hypothetical protein
MTAKEECAALLAQLFAARITRDRTEESFRSLEWAARIRVAGAADREMERLRAQHRAEVEAVKRLEQRLRLVQVKAAKEKQENSSNVEKGPRNENRKR